MIDYVAQQCRVLEEAYRQVRHTVGLKQDRQKELYDVEGMVNRFRMVIL